MRAYFSNAWLSPWCQETTHRLATISIQVGLTEIQLVGEDIAAEPACFPLTTTCHSC